MFFLGSTFRRLVPAERHRPNKFRRFCFRADWGAPSDRPRESPAEYDTGHDGALKYKAYDKSLSSSALASMV